MKVSPSPVSAVVLLAATVVTAVTGTRALRKFAEGGRVFTTGDRTISRVVQLLNQMLAKSKDEGAKERELYAKHKCYCDDNEEDKTASITSLTKQIGLLENDVQELQGSNGLLSSESAQLTADMAANTQAQSEAKTLRDQESASFSAEEADLTAAIGQLQQAIDVLAAIGSDQTLQAAADHGKFMANYSGSALELQASVKQALLAASAFLKPGHRGMAKGFLQAPFTGAYTAQSGAIFGILKEMKETMQTNLESARSTEQAAATAHASLMKTKKEEFDKLKASYEGKQSRLSSNDNSLSGKQMSLAQAIKQKGDDEDFLKNLETVCAEKQADYESRKVFRANEEAAIAEAVAILDSDHAFEAFGKVKATSEGSTGFLQLSSVHRRVPSGHGGSPSAALQLSGLRSLGGAAGSRRSSRLARIATLVAAGSPFVRVLDAINETKALVAEEGRVDQERLDWCTAERKANGEALAEANGQITSLGDDITVLEQSIDDPEKGFKKLIQDAGETFMQNSKSQADETEVRRKENAVYQQSVADAVEAAALLSKAIGALEKYYKAKEEEREAELGGLLQQDPAPPGTWTGNYTGQSGQGNKVIEMLNFVLSETLKEETLLHTAEQESQLKYEESMSQLKTMNADLQTQLAKDKKALASAEKDLEAKREDLDKTQRQRIAIDRYLERIKPGCDFIANNFADREANRAQEVQALEKVVTLLQASPAFAAAKAAEEKEMQGSCQAACEADDAHVSCKACLAGVSVPGYCAGHAGTPGC